MKHKNITNKTASSASRVYFHLPKFIRRFLLSFFRINYGLKSRCRSLIRMWYLPSHVLHGKEKHSGEPLTVLLIKDDGHSNPYLSTLLFSEKPKKENIGKIYLWNIDKKIAKLSYTIDAVFIKSDQFYARSLRKHGFIILPRWVSMTLDVSSSLDDIFKRCRKDIRQRIRKVENYGYSYEISTDIDKLKMFYYKMYLPYIHFKYGKTSLIQDFHVIRSIFENGKLMLVKDGDEYIFGDLIQHQLTDKDKALSTHIAVMEGKTDYLKQNVFVAYRYFLILWAKENGIKLLDFGFCRPFLNDGVLQHKKKWGMEIGIYKNELFASKPVSIFGFKICDYSKGIQSFLVNNPFICIDKNQLKAMIVVHENHQLTPEEIKHFLKKYYIPGIAELVVAFPQSLGSKKRQYIYTTGQKNKEDVL